MTYADLISALRLELRDIDKITRDSWNGDNSTTIFNCSHFPIKNASFTLKVDDVELSPTTDYSLDQDTGMITFVSAPAEGTENVVMTYKYNKFRDSDYLTMINDAIDHFQWKFWNIVFDESLTSVKDQNEYDCSTIDNLLYVLKAWFKSPASSVYWQEIQGLTNWKYYAAAQILTTDPALSIDGLPMKLLTLQSFAKGDDTDSDLNIPVKWLGPYKFYVYAKFYERCIPEKLFETAAISTIPNFSPVQQVVNIVEYFYKKAEESAIKIAPKLPPMSIRNMSEGIIM